MMDLKVIEAEIGCEFFADTPKCAVETAAQQLLVIRECKAMIEKDGVIVRDAKGHPVEHPALSTQRASTKLLNDILKAWCK
jgi:hypothetical protein